MISTTLHVLERLSFILMNLGFSAFVSLKAMLEKPYEKFKTQYTRKASSRVIEAIKAADKYALILL